MTSKFRIILCNNSRIYSTPIADRIEYEIPNAIILFTENCHEAVEMMKSEPYFLITDVLIPGHDNGDKDRTAAVKHIVQESKRYPHGKVILYSTPDGWGLENVEFDVIINFLEPDGYDRLFKEIKKFYKSLEKVA